MKRPMLVALLALPLCFAVVPAANAARATCSILGSRSSDDVPPLQSPALNPVICGRGGSDLLFASASNSGAVLRGGPDGDMLAAQNAVRDVLRGGPGFDTCFADPIDVLRSCERVYIGK